MNLFETAAAIKTEQENKARKGTSASLASTITVPYFKGLYRKGDKYTVTLAPKVIEEKGVIVDAQAQAVSVKPLTGAFLISYMTCLAYTFCKDNTKTVKGKTVADPMPLTVHVVQALLQIEGFSLDDYAQGKTTGSKRIEQHLKAVSEQRALNLSVDTKTGIITGLTDTIVNSVLSAI
jgi:hypothetical protein